MLSKKISYNSPVVLSFALISLVALVLGYVTNDVSTYLLFATYRSSLLDPMTIVRLFTHCLGHAGFEHYYGNMMIFLLLGPMLEEKYGFKNLLLMIIFTAGLSGIINSVIFPNVVLLGASGICFMFIILSSITCVEDGKIPLTFLVITVMYLGNEIYTGLFTSDNISQLTHIIGGICGAAMGMYINRERV